MKDNISLKGHLRIENLTTGQLIEHSNTIVTVGKSQIAGLITNDISAGSAFDHIALGLGSSAIAAGDTVLGSEYLKLAVVGTQVTTTVTNDTMNLSGLFAIDATKTINEAGIFNKSGLDTGSMLARTTFADINTSSGDVISTIWKVKIA